MTTVPSADGATAKQTVPPGPGRQVITVHLRNIPLLSGLDRDTLTRTGNEMRFRTFERGAYVAHKGGDGDHLLFVLSGRLKILDVTEDGREIGISFLAPGDYAGELSVIDGFGRSAALVACESSLVAFLPRAAALRLIYDHALVAERVMKRMAAKIRQASDQRAILSIPNAFQRVFAHLLELARDDDSGRLVIVQPPTQQEIAGSINTARETVSRAMQTLFQKGVIEKDGRRLVILQPAMLKQLATEERGSTLQRPASASESVTQC